ncbi:uncharacterized protein TM35_000031490 [Trypanosoma theileri]|uniref:Uncharacterized protein n=1 Tax=Trypanosoma theileri TaxID=67003 RepID=A0A1X0P630_9TRYP|nr:uncharacterized protein TM35_000031490 [Trypanosoma theileri]ORC92396.1 hypothetical protein TM35_000031490 [Trypanosoma theileri]
MAVVQTHCFNWMGYEGTESETLNLALLRHGNSGNLRYADYCQRQEVLADIRLRLKLIKRDLGLLPPEAEETPVDDAIAELSEDESLSLEAPISARPKEEEKKVVEDKEPSTLLAVRQRALQSTGTGRGSDSDEDEEIVYVYPAPPSADDTATAAKAAGAALRSVLFEAGATYVSYIDGAEFTSTTALAEHNEAKRAELTDVELPEPGAFDLAPLEAALEERTQLRLKLDAVRAARDPEYAAAVIPASERDNSGNPITNVDVSEADEAQLSQKLTKAVRYLAALRELYNNRASKSANAVQLELANKVQAQEL